MQNEDIFNTEETLNELFGEEEKEIEETRTENINETLTKDENEEDVVNEESILNEENILNKEQTEQEEQEEKNPSDEYFQHLLKLQAEFDNFRKRTDGDIKKAYQSGFTDAIIGFLPAIDSFKMAKEYIADKNTLVGIEFIEKGILDTLSKMGVTAIDCSGKFDPNLHQAIGSEDQEGFESGDIIKECFKGFVYGDKVIRYSQVIVKK